MLINTDTPLLLKGILTCEIDLLWPLHKKNPPIWGIFKKKNKFISSDW
jgi:hypothetical protein